jgi:hypothetical protein
MVGRVVALVALFVLAAAGADELPRPEVVRYFADRVEALEEGRVLRLAGGSEWRFAPPIEPLRTPGVVVVFRDLPFEDGSSQRVAFFHGSGDEEPPIALWEGGGYEDREGFLTRVVGVRAGGGLLELPDGSAVAVHPDDQARAAGWREPYNAVLAADRSELWNLVEIERVRLGGE